MKTKFFILLSVFFCIAINAQIFDIIKDVAKKKATEKAAGLVGDKVKNAITKEAITTNFKDCDTQNIKNKNFGDGKNYTSLCTATFTDNGFELKPGYYTLELKSFCLKAGTYAPSKGDGYLYAPLKGPKAEIVNKIVKNWYNDQSIEQKDVQALLWAIIAKTNFKNLSPELLLVANKLLSKKDLLSLSGMGLDFVPSSAMSEIKSNLPKSVQMVLEAENKMRQLFTSSSYNYSELEKYAMLTGFNTEKSPIDYGTWGLHPKGFWIAYEPQGFSLTTVKIYVPDNLEKVFYIPSKDVAVPANTGSQRLYMSDVTNCN